MTTVNIGNLAVKPGEIGFGSLGEIFLPDSSKVSIPLIVVNGLEKGPTLWISSTMHGTELTGAEVIRRLTRELISPKSLRGAIVALPIVNPLAFNYHMMNTPQDLYNLNRVFPGSPTGLTSSRLANLLVREGISKCDYIVDFHANPGPAMCFGIIKKFGRDIDMKAMAMAKAFGITLIQIEHRYESHRTGTIIDAAADLGKPALVVELLYWRRIDSAAVDVGVRGLMNIMKHLGMLEGLPEPQVGTKIIEEDNLSRVEITANKGGIVHMYKEAGEWVRKGEKIASIINPYGDTVEEIVSPVNGFILAFPLLGNQAVATGDIIAFVGFQKNGA
jgi:predicted deacylase